MSAVLPNPAAAPAGTAPRSEGVWHAAWRRFKGDRVGLVSMLVVVGFLLMILLAGLNIVAQHLQTRGPIGYVMTDVDDVIPKALLQKLCSEPAAIRCELI